MTEEQTDAIIRAARMLRPGTAWNMLGEDLTQADDDAPRVTVPTKSEIDAYLANNP